MSTLRFILHCLCLLLCGSALAPHAKAQGGVGDIVYTVGTTARDSYGRDWGYVLWQATQPALLSNRVFAVYAKPGEATNSVPFARLSIVQLQTDARVIEPLLRRAENIGDDLDRLQDDLFQLFGSLVPANTISRADQLSAVIRGSISDPRNYQNLLLLARNHAGINLALGFADAQLIGPGATTFEVRAYDAILDRDLAVIGRVTVVAGSPTVLPEPGPPVQVPERTPMGDLNLRLRWGTPDGLRKLGLMQFGYNLYRIQRNFAESQGWNAGNPPPLAALTNQVITQPQFVRRVNRIPITPSKLFTLAEAANVLPPTGDTNTMFIMDDDGRGRPGYVNQGFTNGAQFYYYVAARDVLGRDGLLSPGLLATVCDRMPPLPPTDVKVVNDYTFNAATKTSNQALRVVWKQSPNTNDLTTNYWIYRWTSLTQMHALSGNVQSNLVAVVPHVTGQMYGSYLDSGPQSPKASTNLGDTFWYTVRGGDAGACAQNLSAPAGPAFGVLRDRIGPAPADGFIEFNCLRPFVRFTDQKPDALPNGSDLENYNFLLVCDRRDERFEWAEFECIAEYSAAGAPLTLRLTNEFPRQFFLGRGGVQTWWTPPRYPNGQQYASVRAYVRCRAGFSNGRVSEWVSFSTAEMPNERIYLQLRFEAFAQSTRTVAGEQRVRDCYEHDPSGGGGGPGGTNDIVITVAPTPTSREYRIYRRVDDGPLSLLCQGPVTNVAALIKCFEHAMPVNGGTICFFVQLLDEHGNPSPLTELGCVDTAPNAPLPVPVLTKITSTGNESSPGMNLAWFCPPYGVERFELRIAGLPTPPLTNGFSLSPYLSFAGGAPSSMTFSNFGTNLTLSFYSFITPKIGAGFGNNGAQFTVPCTIQLGKTYIVAVRAIGKNKNAGEFGNFETFVWHPTNAPVQNVPWPARGLPSTNANFGTLAFFLAPTNASPALRTMETTGNGVLVGFTLLQGRELVLRKPPPVLFGAYDPNATLFTNVLGEKIFPCVLYRYQVPNANYPYTSGDVTQVSPLMERIAFEWSFVPGATTNTLVHDPFIAVTANPGNNGTVLYLWLRDTQPQIAGARYKYVLVRFKANREIDQIIPSNEVEVP